MDTVRYVEAALWIANVVIYGACLWAWLQPGPTWSSPEDRGRLTSAPRRPAMSGQRVRQHAA